MVRIEGGNSVIDEAGSDNRAPVIVTLVCFAILGFCAGGIIGYAVGKFWG